MKKIIVNMMILCSLCAGVTAASAVGYKQIVKKEVTHAAYIETISSNKDSIYVDADYIEWFEGEEADRVFKEREPDAGIDHTPDGYYIINDNDKIRKLKISPEAVVLMQIYNRTGNIMDADIVWNEQITLSKFIDLINSDESLKDFPYHLVINDGVVVKIVQQYIP